MYSAFLLSNCCNSTPDFLANNSKDSRKVNPSTSIIKLKMSPPLPEEKSCQICLSLLIMRLGVFSLVQGLSALKFLPARFKSKYSLAKSSILMRERISSVALSCI